MDRGLERVELRWVSDHHLRLRWEGLTPEAEREAVLRAIERLRSARPQGLIDIVPARASVLLAFGEEVGNQSCAALERATVAALKTISPTGGRRRARLVEIPVCYEAEFAPDLGPLARARGMSEQEAATLHASVEHTVEFIGFMPGFPYLVGLPSALETARLARPRTRVPAGSVAIGADRTGIYPLESPGGWNIIGRTPLRLFDAARDPPSLLATGDRARFRSITRAEFDDLAAREAR